MRKRLTQYQKIKKLKEITAQYISVEINLLHLEEKLRERGDTEMKVLFKILREKINKHNARLKKAESDLK